MNKRYDDVGLLYDDDAFLTETKTKGCGVCERLGAICCWDSDFKVVMEIGLMRDGHIWCHCR